MAELSEKTIIGRGSDHVETNVGSQIMMMSISKGKYFSLAKTAQRIWELIETPTPVSGIVDALTEEYQVPRDQCSAEVHAFVGELLDNGLAIETGNGQAE